MKPSGVPLNYSKGTGPRTQKLAAWIPERLVGIFEHFDPQLRSMPVRGELGGGPSLPHKQGES